MSAAAWAAELDSSDGSHLDDPEPSSSGNRILVQPRLVDFSNGRRGQDGIAISPRKFSQRGVVASTSSESALKFHKGVHGTYEGRPIQRGNIRRSKIGSISDGAIQQHTPTLEPIASFTGDFFEVNVASRGTPMRVVSPNEKFAWAPPFPIPPSHPNLRALLVDGRRLPSWLQFESEDGEFHGTWQPERGVTSKGVMREDDIEVLVTAGAAEVGRFKVVLDRRH
jgi:hypothetical protein